MSPFIAIAGGDEVVQIAEELYLSAERRIVGEQAQLRLTLYTASGSSVEADLPLDAFVERDYLVHVWRAGDALLVVGAERFAMLRLDSLQTFATCAFEIDECRYINAPTLLEHENMLVLATEVRVTLFADAQMRWSWSTRVASNEWCTVRDRPVFRDRVLVVPLNENMRHIEAEIDLRTGLTTVHRNKVEAK